MVKGDYGVMGDYYAVHSNDYHLKTFDLDPTSFLSPLCERLPQAACILDVGCGSGRDLLWLKNRGFNVLGFDRSFQMAALVKQQVGCSVIVGDFTAFDFSRFSMDATILVGALVHLPCEYFGSVFANIAVGVKKDGLVLLTMKEGRGISTDSHGRVFYYWQDEDLRKSLDSMKLRIVHFHRHESVKDKKDMWLTYVLSKTD